MTSNDPRTQSSRYWRSLDRLIDSPRVGSAIEPPPSPSDEFPDGASMAPEGVSRRQMLQAMGASFALGGLASCRRPVEEIVPFVHQPERWIPGESKRYATTMQVGYDALGLLVESYEGRPIKIEGNELHPASQGVANSWMQAALLDLYDPDRLPQVLHREGKQKVASSWDEFLAYWQQRSPELQRKQGRPLAVLSSVGQSPTRARLTQLLQERFPLARQVVHEPLSDENILRGVQAVTGKRQRPVPNLEQVDVVLTLDCDLLLTETGALARVREFANRRRPMGGNKKETGTVGLRLFAIESTLTTTGSNADHRIAIQSAEIPAIAMRLADQLASRGLATVSTLSSSTAASLDSLPSSLAAKIELIAEDLAAAGPRAVVVAGRHQPAELHSLVLGLNIALGSLGTALALHPAEHEPVVSSADLTELAQEVRAGSIDTIVCIDTNPVYTAPADVDFASLLAAVPHSIHLASHRDETAQLTDWNLPATHFLESWGDTQSLEQTKSVSQPLIRPLFDSRSPIELLALLTQDQLISGYELVRETWMEEILGSSGFEKKWNRILHDGLATPTPNEPTPSESGANNLERNETASDRAGPLASGSSDEAAPELPDATPAPVDDAAIHTALLTLQANSPKKIGQGPFELTLRASAAVRDGRLANNGWLQELPDPITKQTWGNAAVLSPVSAHELGVQTGDEVAIRHRDRNLELPVLIVPGQADRSVSVALGYGRSAAGRVGNGIGKSGYALRFSDQLSIAAEVQIEPTDRKTELAITQEHGTIEGRGLVREQTLAAYRATHDGQESTDDIPADPHETTHPEAQLWKSPLPTDGHQWGMAIDLASCVGCNACVIACQAENNIPVVGAEQVRRGREMHWLRIDRYFIGTPQEPQLVFQPVPCMHCENAPCEEVCPVGATVHDREGLNTMVYNRCIGTRYCSNNCPYKVRTFNYFDHTKELPELVQMAMNPAVTVRSRGVMEKCTYCVQRLHEAKRSAKDEQRPLGDGDAKTACQQTCPANAITFGDLNDSTSRVVQAKSSDRNYTLLDELNTRPRTSYLRKIRNPHPEWPRPSEETS